MKKTLLFMMAILLIVLMVSCNSDVGTSGSDNLVEVKIAGEGNSKSLSTQFSSNVPEVSELVWFYTAVKNDTGLYATGQQKTWKEVKAKENNAYVAGLADSSLGQFSTGAWIFSFKGVKNDEYIGTNSEVVVYECASLSQTVDSTTAVYENNTTVYLTIPLTLGSGVNKAKVVFTDLSFTLPSSANLNENYSGTFSLTISGNGSENNIVSSSASINNGVVTFTLPETNYYEYSSAGSHTYTFTVKLGDSDVASLPSYNANVSLGTTASVSGSIEEYANTTYYVKVKTITGEKVTVSNSSGNVPGSTTETMTFTVANTPDSVATGNASSTTIEFTNGYSEASTSDSYYIAQETYGAETAGNFIVTAGENSTNAVAGIDLDLYKVVGNEAVKQTVTNQSVKVTTTIATGLTDVAVNGASEGNTANGVTLISYDSATGELVFTTTHFSQFLVTSSNGAINATKNIAYDNVISAVSAASTGDTIMLLKDNELSSGEVVINHGITLDGNGYKYKNTRNQKDNLDLTKYAGEFKGNRDAAVYVNTSDPVVFKNLKIETTKIGFIFVGSSVDVTAAVSTTKADHGSITISNCDFKAPGNRYGFFVNNNVDYLTVTIDNSKLEAWAAIYAKSKDSSYTVKNSVLTGVNTASTANSNSFGTIVVESPAGANDTGRNNNTITITGSTINALPIKNAEEWLCLQYGAHHNTVTVTSTSIIGSNGPLSNVKWETVESNTNYVLNSSYTGTNADSDDYYANWRCYNTVRINGEEIKCIRGDHL